MASAVFTSLGQALGGPFGALAGAVAGSAVDSVLFGRMDRSAVEQVQRSAYGVAIPRIFGRVRVAGGLIWAQVLDQGAKGSGQRAGAASIAVAVSSRPIRGVGRIWADGREIRNAAGMFESPTVMRVHKGDNREPDPAIEASEGMGNAPGYAGLAYVVFENLSLEPFGNRIPNLSFEVDADDDSAGAWLCEMAGAPANWLAGPAGWGVAGYVAAAARAREDVAPLMQLAGRHAVYAGGTLAVGVEPAEHRVPRGDVLMMATGGDVAMIERTSAASARPSAAALGYLDVERDYQAGLQRAVRRSGEREDALSLMAAMSAQDARAVAHYWLRERELETETIRLVLGWKWMAIAVGDRIILDGEGACWRVTQRTVRGLAVHLVAVLEADTVALPAPADAGRALTAAAQIIPPTRLSAFEMAPTDGGTATLVLGANGGAGWKGCVVHVLRSWEQPKLGKVRDRRPAGRLMEPLAEGGLAEWDEDNAALIELWDDELVLESRPIEDVLDGANLLRVGGELLRFRSAMALGAGRYALRGLFRNCIDSGESPAAHAAGTEVEMLFLADMIRIPIMPDMIGQTMSFCAEGRGDAPGGVVLDYVVRGV